MAVNIIHLVCKLCGAGVNKVEYDPAASQQKIQAAAATLGVDPSALAQHATDSEADARQVAQNLANPTDSPCPTPNCPGGEVEVR